jgi:hypothetical protein
MTRFMYDLRESDVEVHHLMKQISTECMLSKTVFDYASLKILF